MLIDVIMMGELTGLLTELIALSISLTNPPQRQNAPIHPGLLHVYSPRSRPMRATTCAKLGLSPCAVASNACLR